MIIPLAGPGFRFGWRCEPVEHEADHRPFDHRFVGFGGGWSATTNDWVELAPKAARQLRKLERDAQATVAGIIETLASNPRPPKVELLKGGAGEWRVRSGDYRVVYQIEDALLRVLVVAVGDRKTSIGADDRESGRTFYRRWIGQRRVDRPTRRGRCWLPPPAGGNAHAALGRTLAGYHAS